MLANDDIMQLFFDTCNELGLENVKNTYFTYLSAENDDIEKITSIAKTLIKDHPASAREPGDVFTEVNKLLCESNNPNFDIDEYYLNEQKGEINFQEDSRGNVVVKGLSKHTVTNEEEAFNLLLSLSLLISLSLFNLICSLRETPDSTSRPIFAFLPISPIKSL